MADHSKIEWTDSTWTPIRARNRETGRVGHFCIHKSPGCKHCYSEIMQRRFGNPIRFAAQDAGKVEMFLDETMLTKPLGWKKPRMVFVCSMTDLFLEGVPDEWIDRVFAVMALAPRHVFQVLTKRSERMQTYIASEPWDRINAEAGTLMDWADMPELDVPPKHIWLGVSVEDQQRAAERIPHLLDTPAAVRFLSAEPLLGPIDLTRLELVPDSLDEDGDLRRAGIRVDALRNKHCESGVTRGLAAIDWCIVGGESGPKARPMHPQWARDLRDQCEAAGAAFFFKQWGEWLPGENSGWYSDEDRERGIAPHAVHQDGTRGLHPASSKAKNYVMWEPDGTLHEGHRTGGDYFKVAAWATRVGKKRAGRLLDGREWSELPA